MPVNVPTCVLTGLTAQATARPACSVTAIVRAAVDARQHKQMGLCYLNAGTSGIKSESGKERAFPRVEY